MKQRSETSTYFFSGSSNGRLVLRWFALFSLYGLLQRSLSFFFYKGFPRYTDWSAYESGRIVIDSFSRNSFVLLLAFLLGTAFLLVARENRWENQDLRIFVTTIAFLLGLQWGLVEYNYYLDQGFLLERVLLIVLPVSIYFHPIGVFPFILVFLSYLAQYEIPMNFFVEDFHLALEVLFFFLAFYFLRAFFDDLKVNDFFTGILILLGSYALSRGIPIIFHEPGIFIWITEMNPTYLYGHYEFVGWFAGWPPWVQRLLEKSTLLVAPAVPVLYLVTSLLGLLICVHPIAPTAMILLGLALGTGYYLLSGHFYLALFITALLILCFLPKNNETVERLFSTRKFYLSLLFILPLTYWMNDHVPASNSIQSPYNKQYAFRILDERGSEYPLSPDVFQPFLRHFAEGLLEDSNFHPLDVYRTSPQIASRMNPAEVRLIRHRLQEESPLQSYISKHGKNTNNSNLVSRLDHFFSTFITNQYDPNDHFSNRFVRKTLRYVQFPDLISTYSNHKTISVADLDRSPTELRILGANAVYTNTSTHKILSEDIIRKIPLY